VNELLFKKYLGTRPITPLHNLYPSKPIFTRLLDGWLAKSLVATLSVTAYALTNSTCMYIC